MEIYPDSQISGNLRTALATLCKWCLVLSGILETWWKCMSIYIYISIYMCVPGCVCVCVSVWSACVSVCVCVFTAVPTIVCVCLRYRQFTIHTYIYIYIYIYIRYAQFGVSSMRCPKCEMTREEMATVCYPAQLKGLTNWFTVFFFITCLVYILIINNLVILCLF